MNKSINAVVILCAGIGTLVSGHRTRVSYTVANKIRQNSTQSADLQELLNNCEFGEVNHVINYGLCFNLCTNNELCMCVQIGHDMRTCRMCLFSHDALQNYDPDWTKTYVIMDELHEIRDKCRRNPCINGGTCANQNNSYICHCLLGYIGNRCQDTRECAATLNNSCYWRVNAIKNWTAAEDHCAQDGGHLVEIASQQEDSIIYQVASQFSGTYWGWLGLHDLREEGRFEWRSGRAIEYMPPVLYNQDHKDCVGLSLRFNSWFASPCEIERRFICELEFGGIPP